MLVRARAAGWARPWQLHEQLFHRLSVAATDNAHVQQLRDPKQWRQYRLAQRAGERLPALSMWHRPELEQAGSCLHSPWSRF